MKHNTLAANVHPVEEKKMIENGTIPRLRCFSCNLFIKKGTGVLKTMNGLYYYICQKCEGVKQKTCKQIESIRKRIENRILLGVIALCILSIIYSLTDIYGR